MSVPDDLDELAASQARELEKALLAAISDAQRPLDMLAIEATLNAADEADDVTDHERDQLGIVLDFTDDDFKPLVEAIDTSGVADNLALFFAAAATVAALLVRSSINPRDAIITDARSHAFNAFAHEFLSASSRTVLTVAHQMLTASGSTHSRARHIGRVIGLTEAQAASLRVLRDAFQLYHNAPTKLMRDIATGRMTRVRDVNLAKIIHATRGRISGAQRRLLIKALADEPTAAKIETILDRHAHALRKHRIRVVAGDVVHSFTESAKLAAWQYGQAFCLIAPDQRRYWRTAGDERVRTTHAAVPGMNPDGVALDKPFKTPLGDFMTPPIEYGCRCRAVLGASR